MNTSYIVKLSELQRDVGQRTYILYLVQCRKKCIWYILITSQTF